MVLQVRAGGGDEPVLLLQDLQHQRGLATLQHQEAHGVTARAISSPVRQKVSS